MIAKNFSKLVLEFSRMPMQTKADILARLRNDILNLQGFKPQSATTHMLDGLGRINECFPNKIFPLAAVHEFLCTTDEDVASSGAFITGLLSLLANKKSTILWVNSSIHVFPPAVKSFGIEPNRILFLRLKKEKEIVWAIEEALRCGALSAIIGELPEISLLSSRRFQLAIEQNGTACFLLRQKPRNLVTAAVTRWQIRPLSSSTEAGLPGVGYPKWKVELLRVRNGKSGHWEIEWRNNSFCLPSRIAAFHETVQKKTG